MAGVCLAAKEGQTLSASGRMHSCRVRKNSKIGKTNEKKLFIGSETAAICVLDVGCIAVL
jgi:hypothetical protein